MGNINGNIETIKHTPDNLLQGNNEFESATLKLAKESEAKDGYVLARNTDGQFEVADATSIAGGTGLAVLVDRDGFKNESTTAAATYTARVCVSGKVKRELVTLGGTALTDANCDSLRGFGILVVDPKQIGKYDTL